MKKETDKQGIRFWAANSAAWAVTALVSSVNEWAATPAAAYSGVLLFHVLGWLPWVGLTWLVFRMITPPGAPGSRPFLAAGRFVGLSVVWISVYSVYLSGVSYLMWGSADVGVWAFFLQRFRFWIWFDYAYFWGVVGVAHAFVNAKLYRDAAARARRMEQAARDAELRFRVQQIQPHFLFNALNAVAALARTDKAREAVNAIDHLSGLLRYALKVDALEHISLDDELGVVRSFIEIERLRFDGGLALEVALDKEVGHVRVPPMILQPLVENAVRHGVQAHGGPLTVSIRARLVADFLEVVVTNPAARETQDEVVAGVGLENVGARLYSTWGERARLEFGFHENRAEAKLLIPLGKRE